MAAKASSQVANDSPTCVGAAERWLSSSRILNITASCSAPSAAGQPVRIPDPSVMVSAKGTAIRPQGPENQGRLQCGEGWPQASHAPRVGPQCRLDVCHLCHLHTA